MGDISRLCAHTPPENLGCVLLLMYLTRVREAFTKRYETKGVGRGDDRTKRRNCEGHPGESLSLSDSARRCCLAGCSTTEVMVSKCSNPEIVFCR